MKGRQRDILEVALALLAEEGYGGLTVRRIAERVGVTEPAIYRHFSSKDELLFCLYDYVWEKMEPLLISALRSEKGCPERLGAFLGAVFLHLERNRGVNLVLLSEAIHHNRPCLKEAMGRLWDRVSGVVAVIVEEAKESGALREDVETEVLVRAVLGFVQASVTKSLIKGSPLAGEREVSSFVSVLWEGAAR